MVACIGPLAAIDCELRQARKGATVTMDSGAEVWLVQVAFLLFILLNFFEFQTVFLKCVGITMCSLLQWIVPHNV